MPEEPAVPTQPPQPPAAQPGNGLAVASLVLGIVAVALICIWYVSMPSAVLAIILGVVGRSKAVKEGAKGKGMATASVVLGIVAIGLAVLVIFGFLAALGIGKKAVEENPELFDQMRRDVERGLQTQPTTQLDVLWTYARSLLA